MSRKILLVEDDAPTADYVTKGLIEAGFSVDRADNGRDGLFHASDGSYDLAILDRMLPGLDGLSVLRAMRAANIDTPVIILSAMGSIEDRVMGLSEGSDDYLVKPFSFSELLARVEALLRRHAGSGRPVETQLHCADLAIDLLSRKVTRGDTPITLQPREYRLLEYFVRHKNQVVTRTMLLEGVWDYHFDPQTNVIDVHISRLRQKIDRDFDRQLLHTVRGAGYILSDGS